MTIQYQIIMGYIAYDDETEIRPGKWDFTELLDLPENRDCYFTDDGLVYETLDEANVELEYRIEKLKS